MKLTETIESIILLEYSRKLVDDLTKKFKEEYSGLKDEIIMSYITKFNDISSKLDVSRRDITKYSWKELETAVDSNRSTRIKAGKIDVTAEDSNLLYNNNGIRLYHGNSKKACIKYGNGYSFCISARGDDNMYDFYRKELGEIGTPYFVFNDNLTKEDENHVLVIFIFGLEDDVEHNPQDMRYTITTALNDGERDYKSINDIINDFPWIKEVESFIRPKDISGVEKEMDELQRKCDIERNTIQYNVYKILTNEVIPPKHKDYEKSIWDSLDIIYTYYPNAYDLIMEGKNLYEFYYSLDRYDKSKIEDKLSNLTDINIDNLRSFFTKVFNIELTKGGLSGPFNDKEAIEINKNNYTNFIYDLFREKFKNYSGKSSFSDVEEQTFRDFFKSTIKRKTVPSDIPLCKIAMQKAPQLNDIMTRYYEIIKFEEEEGKRLEIKLK
jgi:hypothetical protein